MYVTKYILTYIIKVLLLKYTTLSKVFFYSFNKPPFISLTYYLIKVQCTYFDNS